MRQQRMRRDEYVTARHEHAHRMSGKFCEERPQSATIAFVQDRKPRKRASFASIERRGDPPNAAAPIAQFQLLDRAVLFEAIGRIGHDRMNRMGCMRLQPMQRVGKKHCIARHPRYELTALFQRCEIDHDPASNPIGRVFRLPSRAQLESSSRRDQTSWAWCSWRRRYAPALMFRNQTSV